MGWCEIDDPGSWWGPTGRIENAVLRWRIRGKHVLEAAEFMIEPETTHMVRATIFCTSSVREREHS